MAQANSLRKRQAETPSDQSRSSKVLILSFSAASSESSEPSPCSPPSDDGEAPSCLAGLFSAGPWVGPADFGGHIAEMLWGMKTEYSLPTQYLLLFFAGSSHSSKATKRAAKRICRPDVFALMRCSRSVCIGVLGAIEVRRRTKSRDAPSPQRRVLGELCETMEQRYPQRWAEARILLESCASTRSSSGMEDIEEHLQRAVEAM
mmetsp:Transcript_36628/g.67139  ORF Transcript_36628/g.67139 Transcript_36628/m.67139 type:complete len:204 (-) Transcript_36628:192-803(-)